jgi:hypothetical protein
VKRFKAKANGGSEYEIGMSRKLFHMGVFDRAITQVALDIRVK